MRYAPDFSRDYTQEIDGQRWTVRLHFAYLPDRAECIGVDLFADTDPAALKPVTSTVWRAIHIGSLIAKARRDGFRSRADERRAVENAIAADDEAALAKLVPNRVFREIARERYAAKRAASTTADPTPRRGSAPAHDYSKVAATYERAYQRGESTTTAVAKRFRVTDVTARKLIQRARDQGLLMPAQPRVRPRPIDASSRAKTSRSGSDTRRGSRRDKGQR